MTGRRLCVLTALVPLAAAGGLSAIRAVRMVPAPYELGYGEGLVLWQALHITHPGAVYHPIASTPFAVGVYPPLYLMVVGLFGGLIDNIQLAGRLTTVIAFVGVLAAAGRLARIASGSSGDGTARRIGILISILLALSVSSTRLFLPDARVDGLGLCLTLSGLAVFLGARGSLWKEGAAAALFVAAMFTKQTFIAAPLACVIVAAVADIRKAARLVAMLAVMALVPMAWLLFLTRGQILLHLFVYTQNRFSVPRLVELLGANLREMLPLIGLAAILPALFWKRGGATMCLSVYVLLALAVSVTSGKIGSAPYYFMEWNVACSVLAGAGFSYLIDRMRFDTAAPATIAATVLLAGFGAVAAVETANQALHLTSGSKRFEAARLDETARVLDLVKHTPGPVYSDDLTILVRAGRDPVVEPFIMFELARGGQWDPAAFLDQIEQGYYALVILQHDSRSSSPAPGLPEMFERAMDERYRFSTNIGSYRVYAPL
jgi:hypothetical protein